MEIKNQQTQEAEQGASDAKRRGRFVRYGAIAAALLLVVGGMLGALLASARFAANEQHSSGAMAASADMAVAQDNEAEAASAEEAAPETARKSLLAEPEADGVRAMESYDELYGLFADMQARDAALYGAVTEDAGDMAAAPEPAMGAAESSASASADMAVPAEVSARDAAEGKAACLSGDFSETNTQVLGVDEADIVKTDGKNIYYVANNQFNIISADGKNTKVLSSTLLGNNDKWWSYAAELFLLDDRVMIITQGYATVWTKSTGGGFNDTREQTQVLLYDVSNPSNPKELAVLGQSGNYVSSRMIGDYVYIVTSHYVWQPVRNEPATYVPSLFRGDAGKPVAAGDILVYGTPMNSAYTVVGAIDLAGGTDYAAAKAVFGGASDVYCNQAHLLLMNGEYHREVGEIAPDENGKNVQVTTSNSQTRLLLFDLDGARITLSASTTVPGTLINQFAADEYNGVFRLVATCNNGIERIYTDGVDTYDYEDETYNCLYTLDGALDMLGELKELAPDEWIESVRFDGEIGYFVTFRQVDPLFAVDLSNPKAPTLLSELKIPGFSEYLHVYGDGLLLGLGYEADVDTGATKGVKLSMFDVSDARKVRELTTERIDASWTVVGSNHKAILVSVEKNLIAFPADDSYYIYRYLQTGFEQLAKVHVGDLGSWNLRGLFIGDCFYVLGDGGITVISMTDWSELAYCTISYG